MPFLMYNYIGIMVFYKMCLHENHMYVFFNIVLGGIYMKRSYSISRRLFALLMVFALAIVPCATQAAKKPVLSKKKISVKVGETYTLKIKNSV